jgi:hypothetical protein
MSRNGAARGLVGAAGIILLGTAAMHATGYRPLVEQLGSSSLQPAWLAGVKGLWLVFSLHLAILGILFLAAAVRPGLAGKGILAIAGLIPAGDTVMLLAFVGVFPGSVLLGLAALLIFTGVALRQAAGEGTGPKG